MSCITSRNAPHSWELNLMSKESLAFILVG